MDIIDFFETLYQIVLIMLCCVAFVAGVGRGRHYWCSKQARKNNASTLLPPLEEARRVADGVSLFLSSVLRKDGKSLERVCSDADIRIGRASGIMNNEKSFQRLVQLVLALGYEFHIVHKRAEDIEGENAYSRPNEDLTPDESEKLRISGSRIEIDSFRI